MEKITFNADTRAFRYVMSTTPEVPSMVQVIWPLRESNDLLAVSYDRYGKLLFVQSYREGDIYDHISSTRKKEAKKE